MIKPLRWTACFLALVVSAACSPKATASDFSDIIAVHPAARTFQRLYADPHASPPDDFRPTDFTRNDYLRLIEGEVDFWKAHLSPAGAILDPYEKDEKTGKLLEKQYSTPAFALVAAEVVKEAGREDLLQPAVRSFSFALTALVRQTTANQHADFYIPMLIHAYRILKSRVPAETAAKWERQFKSIVPEINYRDTKGGGNWNLVNVSGESMRRKDGLVATTQATTQRAYTEKMLKVQQKDFTRFGMYHDANYPLAYDAFPRLWMEDMLADACDDSAELPAVEKFLALGSFSSLLLMSPSGEWACGGRSAHHQWNEAENAVIGEINAARWHARGRDDVAGAFKRMARLGLKSMYRWRRQTGEMWIVKNFAPPSTHFGFEGYSFNSQYNLLPMAMLAIAYERADDRVAERPIPAEFSSYIYDLRDGFTKVVAAAGGYYVEIDTNADDHYNATGLQRIHRRGVELSPLSDSAAGERAIIAAKDDPKVAMSPGIQWKDGDAWVSLADYHRFEPPPKPKMLPGGVPDPQAKPPDIPQIQRVVFGAELSQPDPASADFTIRYQLGTRNRKANPPVGAWGEAMYDPQGQVDWIVTEHYTLSADGVRCRQGVEPGARTIGATRFVFPAMVNDGRGDVPLELRDNSMTVRRSGGVLTLNVTEPTGTKLALVGPRVAMHNGYYRAAMMELQTDVRDVEWNVTLAPPAPTPRP